MFKLSPIEAIVMALAKSELACFRRDLWMDEPTDRLRLVECPWSAVILEMNNKRASGSRCRQHSSDAMDYIDRIGNSRLAIEQTLLRVDHE
jgi:hypothetical protein